MDFLSRKTLNSFLVPGAFIVLGAILLLDTKWIALSQSEVTFFYYATFVAGGLLAWRFHSNRIVFSVIVLLLGHHAVQWFAQRGAGPALIAFDAIALLIPLNFAFLTFFTERGDEGRTLLWFLALLFFESVFVAAAARPDQTVPGFLHFAIIRSYHSHLPQPAILMFSASLCLLMFRFAQFHRATDSGMFWSLVMAWLGFHAGPTGKPGTAYFGAAALALAGSIIENTYSLAYQDELTGLHSRRSFNDASFRLKAPYAIAVVDIDHFKSVNDNYGHDTGDHVLRLVASKLARVGGGGQAFRVGGEEFTILFPNKNASAVVDYLDLLRMNIESSTFRVRSGQERRKISRTADRRTAPKRKAAAPAKSSTFLSVTVSIGIAQSRPKAYIDEIIEEADQALYRAKQGGRNRIEVGGGAPEKPKRIRSKKAARP
jgi:diguanylate cyclase (GGDEF)-like protein